jgi:signal transduction histidine kinase
MSHELRTALSAIAGISEGLLERMCGELNERQAATCATPGGLFTRGVYSVNKMRLIQLQVSVSTYCYHPGSNGPGSEKPWIDSTFA